MPKRKKTGGPHFSSMAYRIDRLPGPGLVRKETFLKTLISYIDGEMEEGLPKNWEVTWGWRNSSKEEPWAHSDTFEEAIENSTSGFVSLMRQRLTSDLEALNANVRTKTKKRRRPKRATKKRARKTAKASKGRKRVSKVRKKRPSRKRRRT